MGNAENLKIQHTIQKKIEQSNPGGLLFMIMPSLAKSKKTCVVFLDIVSAERQLSSEICGRDQ